MRKTVTRSLRETPFAAHGKVPIERFEVETRQSSAAEPRRCKGKLNRFNCGVYVIDSKLVATTYLHRRPNVKLVWNQGVASPPPTQRGIW
jgi:hypothetical protein